MKPKTYATATAFRRALEDRLAAVTKAEGVNLQRIRRHVAFDRLLSRLFAEGNLPWVLKGGYALELKLSSVRTTKDIDLGLDHLPGSGWTWDQRAVALLAVLQEKVALDLGDFFTFLVGEPTLELEAAPYSGARYPIEAAPRWPHVCEVPARCRRGRRAAPVFRGPERLWRRREDRLGGISQHIKAHQCEIRTDHLPPKTPKGLTPGRSW